MTSAQLRYVGTLGAAAVLILTVGWFLKPAAESGQTAEPSDLDLAKIAQMSRRSAMDDISNYFSDLTDRVAPSLGDLRQPRLTRSDALGRGEWLVAVWRTAAGHGFASGHFIDLRPVADAGIRGESVASTLRLEEPMLGGGLFDLDGRLVAVISRWQGAVTALTPPTLAAIDDEAQSAVGQLRIRYGLSAGAMTEAEEAVLGAKPGGRLVVREVRASSAAARAGVLPGDVVIMAGDRAIESVEDFSDALSAPGAAKLVVRWKARQRSLTLPDDDAMETTASSGLAEHGLGILPPAGGIVIDRVGPGSRAERAGIRPGDRLLSVDRAAIRDAKQLDRALQSRAGAVFVVLQREDRLIGLVLSTR